MNEAVPPLAEALRVLVVDDEAPARARLRDLLGDVGAQQPNALAGMAANGVEALRLLEDAAVDVVLADDFAEINIGLALKFGAKINDVCTAVQTAVKDNVQTMTGMAVSKVNVYVAKIVFPQDEEANQEN